MSEFDIYEVGGCVRDSLLGIQSKDIDFTAVATDEWDSVDLAFRALSWWLIERDFEIFLTSPEYLTIRARFPTGHAMARTTADFVLARKDGPYSDGRRPDWVLPGTLEDDLNRRDFTVNAIARTIDGEIIDLHHGVNDLHAGWLRFVGKAEDRLNEDPLRAFRGLRFELTKGLHLDHAALHAIAELEKADFRGVSTDRIRDELEKCFRHDTWATLSALMDSEHFATLATVAFNDRNLRLIPSMKEK